jgi:hypothetical protein
MSMPQWTSKGYIPVTPGREVHGSIERPCGFGLLEGRAPFIFVNMLGDYLRLPPGGGAVRNPDSVETHGNRKVHGVARVVSARQASDDLLEERALEQEIKQRNPVYRLALKRG